MGLDCDITRTRTSHIRLMRDTVTILGYLLAGVDQATATTLRDPNDGDKGWTVVEVVCHLRDYDHIFLSRARQMVAEANPLLPGYDHEQLAIENRYNDQELSEVFTALQRSRTEFVAFFQDLDEGTWNRAATHPERGRFTMDDALMQVGLHDTLHIEQITRILRG